jgi:OOP family OmpA-OmpF porin
VNTRTLLTGLLAATALSTTLVSHADDHGHGIDKRFYGAFQANYNYFDSDSNLQDQEGYTISLGKPIFSWLDLELQAFRAEAKDSGGNKLDYQGYGLAARLFPGRYTMPFYGLVAYSIGDDESLSNDDSDFIDLGVGYVHAFTEHGSSIRTEYRARRSQADGTDSEPVNHVVSLGIEIPFGAAKPLNPTLDGQQNYRNVKVAQRPATSDWTSNVPCADADFDGVCDFGDQCANTPVGVEVDGKGCTPSGPAAAPITAEAPMILEGVEFEFDSAELTTTSYPILDRAAETLHAYAGVPVEVAGHTDGKGSFSYNLNLSTLRAQAVYEYLLSKGISSQRLSYQGYGESDPIADNSNADGSDNTEGRARNRRVELRAAEK